VACKTTSLQECYSVYYCPEGIYKRLHTPDRLLLHYVSCKIKNLSTSGSSASTTLRKVAVFEPLYKVYGVQGAGVTFLNVDHLG